MSGDSPKQKSALAGALSESSQAKSERPKDTAAGVWKQDAAGQWHFYKRSKLRELFARDLARDVFGGTWSRPTTDADRSPGDVKAELDRIARGQANHQRERRAESDLRRIALELKAQAQHSFAGTIASGGAS